MESSLVKSGGSKKSKKNRFVDTPRLNNNAVSRTGTSNGKRKGDVEADDLEKTRKKKTSRKEAFLNRSEVDGKKSRSNLEKKAHSDGVDSDNLTHSEGKVDLIRSLASSPYAVPVPKRLRGYVGRKESEQNHVSSSHQAAEMAGDQVNKRVGSSSDKVNSDDNIPKSNGSVEKNVSTSKGKLVVDGNKKSSSKKKISAPVSITEKKVSLIVNNEGDASSSRNKSSNNRKRKGSESLKVKVEPRNASSLKVVGDSPDEDEKKLEQNAAMMLSSLFDPSCTQLSPNGNSSLISPDDDSNSKKYMSVGFELASGDRANRVLRSREKNKRHSLSKKRRHFYEISSRDVDAPWVLNRRISVYWPLDESWYNGWVTEYSPETKLHQIKYDDQDEEWVDLKNEKFKLLLFPGEVPHEAEPKEDMAKNKIDDDRDLPSDDSLEGTYLDSEPIKSWVNRSRRVKSSKRQKASHLLPKSSQKLSAKVVSTVEQIGKSDPSKMDANKLDCYFSLPDSSSNPSAVEQFQLGSGSISRDGIPAVVYVRRRFRKKDNRWIRPNSMACEDTPVTRMAVVFNCLGISRENNRRVLESDRRLWFVDNLGLLKLRIPIVDYKEFSLEHGLSVPYLSCTFAAENLVLYRALYLLKYGTIVNIWPKVHLDILFVDNDMGLRFLLFQGSLKQAVEFVLVVMAVFYRPDQKQKFVDMSMPVTSIRFKLSCFENSRKQYVFEVYSFSQVKCSKWLFLNSKLQQHCSLSKQVPLSECTYDNMKRLERGGDQLPLSSTSWESSINEGHWKESLHAIMTKGDSVDFFVGDVYQSPEYSMEHRNIFPSARSFCATPSVNLHMQLLMEANVATIRVREAFPFADSGVSLVEVDSSKSALFESDLGADISSERSGHDQVEWLNSHPDGKFDVSVASASFKGGDKKIGDAIVGSLETAHVGPQLKPFITSSLLLVPKEKVHGLSVEVPSLQPDGRAVVITPTTAALSLSSDKASNLITKTVHSLEATGPRLTLPSERNRNTSYRLRGETVVVNNVFSSGPRKRRTQVQYTMPSDGLESNTKNNLRYHRGLPYQRIRKASDKRAPEVPKKGHRNKGFLACDANILITVCDKGWRERGARVELESVDRNEWKLSVSLSGTTKYSYKANRFLQSASTNRFTHAKMWRGGKDWALEFPDRNQWMVFKEIYDECFNRNLRAASVKNIPIPGVQPIEVCDSGTELPFVRSSNYFKQIETDAEMAMNPSHVLYDMDSEDETWMLENHQKLASDNGSEEVTEELFERTMDMFEKVAYTRQRDDFRLDEIEETMVEIGPMELITPIHEHWRRKRLRKGMPLVRHLRPSLWEYYQLQVKEWEQAVARSNSVLSSGCHDKTPPPEKPPTFAFCLKPRGLEMPNKGTKQRSHRRCQFSESSSFPLLKDHHQGDQSSFHATGRRSNKNANYGDEKVMYLGNSHEHIDTSPPFKPRVFSPRDASGFPNFSLGNGTPEFNNQYSKLHRNKSKNAEFLGSTKNLEILGAYNQKTISMTNGVDRWNTSFPKWSIQKHNQSEVSLRYGLKQLDGSNLDEFRLRDVCSAAQHARNMARLKRERAQRLLYIANVATHNAVTSVMSAEVIKTSFEESDKEDNSDDDVPTDYDFYGDDSDEDDDSDDSDRTR